MYLSPGGSSERPGPVPAAGSCPVTLAYHGQQKKLLPASPVGVITPPEAGTRELHRYERNALCHVFRPASRDFCQRGARPGLLPEEPLHVPDPALRNHRRGS